MRASYRRGGKALDETESAISDHEEAIRRKPSRDTHYLDYARLFSRKKCWAAARDVIVRGLNVLTGDAAIPLLREKARTSNEQEDAEVGLRAADAVLSLAPNQGRALYQRAWAVGMLGRLAEALASLHQFLEPEPTNVDARRALPKIEVVLPQGTPSKPCGGFGSEQPSANQAAPRGAVLAFS